MLSWLVAAAIVVLYVWAMWKLAVLVGRMIAFGAGPDEPDQESGKLREEKDQSRFSS